MTQPIPTVAPPPRGSFGVGLAAAVAAALVGAIAWAIITVVSNYRIGLVAVGIGFLVGLAIERFGGGDRRLPVAGALIALLGCMLGYLFADAHIVGKAYGFGTFDAVNHLHRVWSFYTGAFGVFDGIFYAIAAYAGYRYAQRGVLRAQAAAAANHPASIEVTGSPADPQPAPSDPPMAP